MREIQNTQDPAAHQELHDIDWENTFVLDNDADFFKRKVKESLLIRQKNFNQDSGLAVSPIYLIITFVKIYTSVCL